MEQRSNGAKQKRKDGVTKRWSETATERRGNGLMEGQSDGAKEQRKDRAMERWSERASERWSDGVMERNGNRNMD